MDDYGGRGFGLVTGASSGIGRAIAIGLSLAGMKLGLVGRRGAALRDVARECGGDADPLSFDLTDKTSVAKLAECVSAKFERLDLLVHCAGIMQMGTTNDAVVEDFDDQLAINVRAPYLLSKLLLPSLRSARGQIVFINSSIVRASNIAGRGQYAATRHALKAVADGLRDDLNADGVRVTSIYPGSTDTPGQRKLYEATSKEYCPERLMRAEDVAQAVQFAINMNRTAEVTDIYLRPMQKP
jgi:NADP-dependent 3-hydroxy acid dehydrogenase YdfG